MTDISFRLKSFSNYNVSNGMFRGASGNYYTFKNRKGWNQYTGTKAQMNRTMSNAKWSANGAMALGTINYIPIINHREELGNATFGIEMISNTISTFAPPIISIPWTIGYEGLGRNGIGRIPWYQNNFKPWVQKQIRSNE